MSTLVTQFKPLLVQIPTDFQGAPSSLIGPGAFVGTAAGDFSITDGFIAPAYSRWNYYKARGYNTGYNPTLLMACINTPFIHVRRHLKRYFRHFLDSNFMYQLWKEDMLRKMLAMFDERVGQAFNATRGQLCFQIPMNAQDQALAPTAQAGANDSSIIFLSMIATSDQLISFEFLAIIDAQTAFRNAFTGIIIEEGL